MFFFLALSEAVIERNDEVHKFVNGFGIEILILGNLIPEGAI